MLPIFRNPLAVSARVRSVPDLFDRARLATVAVLAAFAALGLALVAHLAISGGPVTVPGLSGLGKVLTATAPPTHPKPSHTVSPGGTAPRLSRGGAGARTLAPAGITISAPHHVFSPPAHGHHGSVPQQVGMTVGTPAASPPVTTSPGSPSSGSPSSSGSGSGTSSTGHGQDTGNGGSGSSTSGKGGNGADNYGHSPAVPTTPGNSGNHTGSSNGNTSSSSSATAESGSSSAGNGRPGSSGGKSTGWSAKSSSSATPTVSTPSATGSAGKALGVSGGATGKGYGYPSSGRGHFPGH